jgi:hypothetical protein
LNSGVSGSISTVPAQEPVLGTNPGVIRQTKFGADNGLRPELHHSDFAVKNQVIELLSILLNSATDM